MQSDISIKLKVKGHEFYFRADLWLVALMVILYTVAIGSLDLETFLLHLIKLFF